MAKIKLDLTGVESFVKAGEGQHVVKVLKVEDTIAQNSGNSMLKITFEVIEGKDKGAKLWDNLVLVEKALWKVKGFLEVIGMAADGKIVLDTEKMVGRVCIADVVLEEYNGVKKAKISDYIKLDNSDTAEEEEEEEEDIFDEEEEATPPPPPKNKKEKKKKKEPEPEPEEEEEITLIENEDGTFELEDGTPCDEEGNPLPPKKEKKKKKKEPEPIDDWNADDGWD